VAIVGAGTGGFAATLSALRNGMRVVLTEETDWIGGQLTSQAVPPDEHPWIEQFGSTRSYRSYRSAVRTYYREHYPLTELARDRDDLNPGNASVSRLAHEFRVSVAVLQSMLMPYIASGRLTLFLEHTAESATVVGDRVSSVMLTDKRRGLKREIAARFFIDATELGKLENCMRHRHRNPATVSRSRFVLPWTISKGKITPLKSHGTMASGEIMFQGLCLLGPAAS
jgi:2-polyprenyl-6-methoxyphenol hydroxylase-like FAD-dependent oxidoreductase